MSYIIVCEISNLRYFVQNYKDELRLNGLVDNAMKYAYKEFAGKDLMEFQRRFRGQCFVEKYPPPRKRAKL